MSILEPQVRSEQGAKALNAAFGQTEFTPSTLLEASLRDYVFAEVWTRPALDRRARFFIAIATAACAGASAEILDGYIRGALTQKEISLGELREAALHLAVYAGWGRGMVMDKAISRVIRELEMTDQPQAPIQAAPWEKQQRLDVGKASFTDVMTFPPPPPATPYFEAGILNFVFAEMWTRPGLDQRGRRWITLACIADSASTTPIRTHTYAAMASGNATPLEMQEFVLQYAIDGGWPKASVMQAVVFEMAKRVVEGLPYE